MRPCSIAGFLLFRIIYSYDRLVPLLNAFDFYWETICFDVLVFADNLNFCIRVTFNGLVWDYTFLLIGGVTNYEEY